MKILTKTYRKKINGTLSCFDKLLLTGMLSQICYSQGMTSYLYSKGIYIFDYAKFAEPFKEFVKMLKLHWSGIINYFDAKITNGVLEGNK